MVSGRREDARTSGRVAHTCGLRAPKFAPGQPRAPGVGLTPPDPGAAGAAQGRRPLPQRPHVTTPLRGRVYIGPAPLAGPWPPPEACGDPGRQGEAKEWRLPDSPAQSPRRRAGKGSPVRAAKLTAWGAGTGGCALDPRDCKTLEQKLAGADPQSAGAATPALAAPRPSSGTRGSLGPHTHLRSSQQQLGVGSSGLCGSRRFCPQVPRLPARRAARPPARLSAPAGPQRRRNPSASPLRPAPPHRPRPQAPPLPAAPVPPALRAGRTLGSVGAAPPPLHLHAQTAAGTDYSPGRLRGPRMRRRATPLRPPAVARGSLRSCSSGPAGGLAGDGSQDPASGEAGGRVRSKLGAALVESCSCRG